MTQHILKQIQVYKQELIDLKQEYTRALTDKSIPLDERYALLLAAPDDMRPTRSWSFSFDCLGMEWEGYERRERIMLSDFISNIEWYLRNGKPVKVDIEWSKVGDQVRYADHDWAALVPLLKEELLEANCIACIFDW